MRIYTVHVRPGREPELVREAFSWGAMLLPTLWFLWNRMWLVALLHFVCVVVLSVVLPEAVGGWVLLAFQILVAMHARDLRRWTLARRGHALAAVVAATDEETAFARLAEQRPDLLRDAADDVGGTPVAPGGTPVASGGTPVAGLPA